MQVSQEGLAFYLLLGIVASAIAILILGVAWSPYKKISAAAPTYETGSLIFFCFATVVMLRGPELQLY